MELGQLEAFLAVAVTGGFSSAGRSIHLSQPALSRRISGLERQMGVKLFDRGRHGVRLTSAGRRLRPLAETIIAAANEASTTAQWEARRRRNELTIALVSSLLTTRVVAVLGAFRARHPGLPVRVRTGLSDEVSSLVEGGEADVGLRFFEDEDRGLRSRVVTNEMLCVVARPNHPLGTQREVHARAFKSQTWIALDVTTMRRNLAGLGVQADKHIVVDCLQTQKGMIEAGFGLGIVMVSSVASEISEGRLRTLAPSQPMGVVPIVAVTRGLATTPSEAEALIAQIS